MKHLYRSETNATLFGILGGLGEYFDLDPTVLRLAFVCALIVTGLFPLTLAYLVALFIVPKRPAGASEV